MTNYSEILTVLESIPFGPERDKALRLELAKAWELGYDTAYNDGGVDSNPYMTTREILERNERITADHNEFLTAAEGRVEQRKANEDARVTAKVTGSVGATAHRSWVRNGRTFQVTAHYNREHTVCMFKPEGMREVCGRTDEHNHEVGPTIL